MSLAFKTTVAARSARPQSRPSFLFGRGCIACRYGFCRRGLPFWGQKRILPGQVQHTSAHTTQVRTHTLSHTHTHTRAHTRTHTRVAGCIPLAFWALCSSFCFVPRRRMGRAGPQGNVPAGVWSCADATTRQTNESECIGSEFNSSTTTTAFNSSQTDRSRGRYRYERTDR